MIGDPKTDPIFLRREAHLRSWGYRFRVLRFFRWTIPYLFSNWLRKRMGVTEGCIGHIRYAVNMHPDAYGRIRRFVQQGVKVGQDVNGLGHWNHWILQRGAWVPVRAWVFSLLFRSPDGIR